MYKAEIGSTEYVFGDGVTDATYIDSETLVSSTDMFEQGIVEVNRAIKTAVY